MTGASRSGSDPRRPHRAAACLVLFVVVLTACQPIQPPAAAAIPSSTPIAELLPSTAPVAVIDSKALAKMEEARGAAPASATLTRVLPQTADELAPELFAYNPFLATFPELRHAPAPAWLSEGVRTTYYVQNATFMEDPDLPDPSGGGYLQYDLVALDRRRAVASAKFILDSGNGVLTPSTVIASYGVPGVGEFWIAPEALAHAEDAIGPNVAVVRMPTTMNGQTYAAVRFQFDDARSTYVWMFEETTGLLLFHLYELRYANGDTEQAGQLGFVAMRNLGLPWRATRAPAWAKPGASLTYDGGYSVLIPGSTATTMPYGLQVEVLQADRRWFEYSLSDLLYGRTNSTGRRVNGVTQLADAVWLPPRGLAKLTEGQILDEDPATGFTTRVEQVGGEVVVLRVTGPAHDAWATYDIGSGLLVGVKTAVQAGIATIQIEAHLTSQTP